jgi:thiol-disulfide isomerase/thioredoxin
LLSTKKISKQRSYKIAFVICFFISGCTNKITVFVDKVVDSKSLLPYSELRIPLEYGKEINVSLKKHYKMDTSFIFYSPVYYEANRFEILHIIDTEFFYIGKNGGDLFFVGDQNFNGRFDDDSLVLIKDFFTNDTVSWLHQFSHKIEYTFLLPFSSAGVKRIVYLHYNIDIYKNLSAFKGKYISDKTGIVGLNLNSSNGYKYGNFKIGVKKYKIISDDLIRARLAGVNKERVYIFRNNKYNKLNRTLDRYTGYLLNDTIKIGSKYWLFSFQSYEGDTIVLLKLSKRKKEWGNKVGQYATGFIKADINGNTINSDSLFKQTTFLIFWGWWCMPCLDRLPDFIALYNKLKGSPVNFLGIALDDAKKIEFTLDEISHYKIPWANVVADMYSKEKSELTHLFDIDSVPTYIIIDKNRKIMYKGYKFQEAVRALMDNIK